MRTHLCLLSGSVGSGNVIAIVIIIIVSCYRVGLCEAPPQKEMETNHV